MLRERFYKLCRKSDFSFLSYFLTFLWAVYSVGTCFDKRATFVGERPVDVKMVFSLFHRVIIEFAQQIQVGKVTRLMKYFLSILKKMSIFECTIFCAIWVKINKTLIFLKNKS